MDNLFNLETDVDVKEYTKVRCKAVLNDTIMFRIECYNLNRPIELNSYNVEFRAVLPSGQIYSEVDNVTKEGNILNIRCDSFLCSEVGEVICSLRIWNSELRQKSSYQIIIKVLSTLGSGTAINSNSLLSAVDSLDLAINKYIELKADVYKGVKKAEDTIKTLNTTIDTGNNINNTLNNTITEANKINNTLNTTINNAKSINIDLKNTTNEAITENSKLTIENNKAIQNIHDLTDLNNTAEQKLQEFRNFDTNQIASRVGNTYNELYPENELCTITHNLNDMPDIQLIYVNCGYNIGGFDEGVYGGNGVMNKGSYKVKYLDDNSFKIFISNNYNILNANVEKVNDKQYVLTSDTSNNSIVINIK